MVSQKQATASISTIGGVGLYVFWSLFQSNSFIPYVKAGTPNIGNIMMVIGLLSLLVGVILSLIFSSVVSVSSWIKKREVQLNGVVIFSWFFLIFGLSFISLLLHVFRFVPLWVTLLSYALVCSIVVYGRIKEKNRFKKYIAGSSGAGEGKDPL